MPKSKYNTNLAAEYYVLSMAYRKGLNAYLTLGNKKSVDILVDFDGRLVTIDVKGLAGTTLWPLDNFRGPKTDHFVVLVSFLGKIADHGLAPECFVVPSSEADALMYKNPKGTRQGITLSEMRKNGAAFKDAWHLIR